MIGSNYDLDSQIRSACQGSSACEQQARQNSAIVGLGGLAIGATAIAGPPILEAGVWRLATMYAGRVFAGANQISRSSVSAGLRQNVQGVVNKIANIGRMNGRAKDFVGVMKERLGLSSGGNHTQEMRQSVDALRSASNKLSGVLEKSGGSMSQAERGAIQGAIDYGDKLRKAMEWTLGK